MKFAYEIKLRNIADMMKSETTPKVNWIVLGTRITLDMSLHTDSISLTSWVSIHLK